MCITGTLHLHLQLVREQSDQGSCDPAPGGVHKPQPRVKAPGRQGGHSPLALDEPELVDHHLPVRRSLVDELGYQK